MNAKSALDYFLFGNIDNHWTINENDWQVTWEGDLYVLRNVHTGELHHFAVEIKEFEWDSRQARIDQEWPV